jgi:hypothetical protein
MITDTSTPRLFVPLANEPFRWFADGQKRWELRRYGRQYTERNVWVGRRVELRRGYSTDESLRGVIVETMRSASIRELFGRVDYKTILPTAESEAEAIEIANKILGIPVGSQAPVFAFRVEIEA